MANNQFPIDRSKIWGMQYSNARDMFLRSLNALRECRGKMVQCFTNPADANSPDHSNLEAQFGLSAGLGKSAFAELDSMLGALGHPDTNPADKIDRAAVWAAIVQWIDKTG